MRTPRGHRTAAVAATVTAFAGTILLASPAYAATTSCISSTTAPWANACTTQGLPAHPYGHYIRVTTSGGLCGVDSWRVFDVANNKTVASGSTATTRTITGLYGTYKASIRTKTSVPPVPCIATITIDNDW